MVITTFHTDKEEKAIELADKVIAKVQNPKKSLTPKNLEEIYNNKIFTDKEDDMCGKYIDIFYERLKQKLFFDGLKTIVELSENVKNNIFDIENYKDNYKLIEKNYVTLLRSVNVFLELDSPSVNDFQLCFKQNELFKEGFFANYLLHQILPRITKDYLFKFVSLAIESEKISNFGPNFLRENNIERLIVIQYLILNSYLTDFKVPAEPKDIRIDVKLPLEFIMLYVKRIEPTLDAVNQGKYNYSDNKTKFTDELTEEQNVKADFIFFNMVLHIIAHKIDSEIGKFRALQYQLFFKQLRNVGIEGKDEDIPQTIKDKVINAKISIIRQLTRKYLATQTLNNDQLTIMKKYVSGSTSESTLLRSLSLTKVDNMLEGKVISQHIDNIYGNIKNANLIECTENRSILSSIWIELSSINTLLRWRSAKGNNVNDMIKTELVKLVKTIDSVKEDLKPAEIDKPDNIVANNNENKENASESGSLSKFKALMIRKFSNGSGHSLHHTSNSRAHTLSNIDQRKIRTTASWDNLEKELSTLKEVINFDEVKENIINDPNCDNSEEVPQRRYSNFVKSSSDNTGKSFPFVIKK